MLTNKSPGHLHVVQNVSLILLSLLFLPLDTCILLCTYFFQLLIFPRRCVLHWRADSRSSSGPQTILVTGVGMAKGLAIARLFHEAGHIVIGADFEPHQVPVCGRFSHSLKKFYRLPKPNEIEGTAYYIQELVRIVHREKVNLWVSCSGVASAVADGQAKEVVERRTDCVAIQYDAQTTAMLHEKDAFITHTKAIGLPVPETHNVRSRDEVHKVLDKSYARPKRYIMKSVGVDDALRGNMALLPMRTLSQTYAHVSQITISPTKPWVLQEFVKGKEYCTHAVVIKGEVLAFVACPSAELLMHYDALPKDSALSNSMLKFTQEFVRRSQASWTGHLSFDFLVKERATEKGLEQLLFPIECNPRAHTAVILFSGLGREISEAYLQAITQVQVNGTTAHDCSRIVMPHNPTPHYWVGHDLVELVLLPLLRLLLFRQAPRSVLAGAQTFVYHLLFWKDGTFEVWDPLPWWWLYHVYWPGMFLASIWHRQWWSRVNVSTTKMFGC